jgi:hypothetical protein
VEALLDTLAAWTPMTATPSAILVGWYTVAPSAFQVDPYRVFELA